MASGKARKGPSRHQHYDGARRAAKPATEFRTFDLTVEPVAPSKRTSISVCMIVKNEAENLRPCLESLGGLASEIVVVDTGSTDATVEMAMEFGAKLRHFPWISDFAAARNESIRDTTGEWIFWLDADDRPSPQAVAQLQQAAASGKADAYMCLVPSTNQEGAEEITEHVRLFRNGLGIRFSSAVHESVYRDLVTMGLRLAYTDIHIEHTGYLNQEAKERKSTRNLAIISSQIELHPNNIDLIFYRGQALGLAKDADGLAADMGEYLRRTKPNSRFDVKRFWAYTSMISVLDTRGDLEGQLRTLAQALQEFPGHPSFLFRLGVQHAVGGQVREAAQELESSLRAMKGPIAGMRPPRARVEARLADCCRALNRRPEALHWAEQALEHDPNSVEGAIILARLHVESGRLEEAQIVLEPTLTASPVAESWMVATELRLAQGRHEDAARALEEARGKGLAQPVAARLEAKLNHLASTRGKTGPASDGPRLVGRSMEAMALMAQGEDLKAAECMAEAIEMNPSDPEGYRYLAAALRKLGREEEALEAWRIGERWHAIAAAQKKSSSVAAPAGIGVRA